MNIYEKLIEVRKTVPYLKKENSGYQFNYVSSSQVLGNLKNKMDEVGLLLIPSVTSAKVIVDTFDKADKNGNSKRNTDYFTEIEMDFLWVNAEKPEEKIHCHWYGQGIDTAGEKGVGKALTYAEKYFMLKFFNIPTDKDDPDTFQKKMEDDEPPHKQKEPEPKKPEPKPEGKPTLTQLEAIGTLAVKKDVDLKLKGIGWTGKAKSSLWTMQDLCHVKEELEKLEDKHASAATAQA